VFKRQGRVRRQGRDLCVTHRHDAQPIITVRVPQSKQNQAVAVEALAVPQPKVTNATFPHIFMNAVKARERFPLRCCEFGGHSVSIF
jgi:hypothetical protein